jgi:hypothetical protein
MSTNTSALWQQPSAVFTDASRNTILAVSGPSGLTGNMNTIMGWQAASGLVTGSGNVFIGARAAPAFTTGDYNIVIGSLAGAGLMSGSYNTIIGWGL